MEIVSCPICESTTYKELFRDRNRRDGIDCEGVYVRCSECSLLYLRERPPWREIVKFYSLLDSGITANAGRVDIQALQERMKKPIPGWKRLVRKVRFRPHSWPLETVAEASKRLLDLGCGNGGKLVEFTERGYEIWGVDVSEDAVDVCRELLPAGHFVVSELEQIDLPDNYFDYIRIDNALEHIPEPQKIIKQCHRLLKKGGKLMVYVPHGESLSMRLMKGYSISSWIPFHLQLFTRSSLRQLLKNSGFKQTAIYGYYPNLWLALGLLQWKHRRRKISSSKIPKWLNLTCYPLGWLASKIGLAEELVAVSIKTGQAK